MAIITSTSFKGTTIEALAASPAEIKASTKVTITDNTYTAANLIAILGKTNNHPVILEKTAAGIPLSATPANLVTIIEGINKYTGSLTAITDPATAEQLNIIAKGTTGIVTATLDNTTLINAATVTALKDVKATDAITFVTGEAAIVGKSDLEAFVALNKKLSNPDWTAIANFKGTASELSAIKSALGIKKTAGVEIITGQISAADANALSKAGGALTATLKSGTVKATLSALKDIKAADALDFTTTETTVNATDLFDLKAKLATSNFDSITTITETAAAVAKDDALTVTTALGYTTATTVNVKISGNISATNAATIAVAATTGTLTATIFPGTAKNLGDALGAVTGALTLTLTDETVVAGDLHALTTVTTVPINANSVKTITALTANVDKVSDVYDAAALKEISGLGNEIISITGDISALQANTLAGLTSGKVVATVASDSAATLLAALAKADAKDELTLKVTGVSTAKDLLALDAKTAIIVDASAVTEITGTAAEIKKVFTAKGIEVNTSSVDIIVTDTAASAADVNAIAKATDGEVKATVATGTAAALNKALADAKGTDELTLKISKGTAAAKDLTDLDAKTSVNVNATAVSKITGNAADVKKAVDSATAKINLDAAVAIDVSGTVSVADADTIAAATKGVVTATIAAGIAADLNVLNDTNTTLGSKVNAYTLTVNGATALATDLNALDGKTSVKVKVDAVEVSGDYADLEKVYVTNKAGFANLGDEKVTISDASVTADKVNVIAKATKGVVTAAVVTANTADVLVENLKDATATDALGLTVDGASAKAADLNALDGKTSVDVKVDATNVTGNIADLTKLYITNADNFANLGGETVTISGTVTAAQANLIANETSAAVTANIAAGTAKALNDALTDSVPPAAGNAYKLTVNGATAAATDLNDLDGKTSEAIKVDAKEITGLQADLNTLFVTNAANFTGEEKVAVKITDTDVVAGLADVIANKTSGVVTANIAAGTAAALNLALDDKTVGQKTVNAYTLTVNDTVGGAAAKDLRELDAKTSVVVDAKAVTAINGSAADIKTVLAAKTITTAANVAANVDGVISAADANTISKATTGVVTATVDAGTAAALKSALAGVSNDNNDALTLKVSGATATAADLIALDAKTSVVVEVNATTITGNIADVTKVLVTDKTHFVNLGDETVTISGTVAAKDAQLIAAETTGKVTATIAAADAATLKGALTELDENAYKLTVSGNDADAADLNILDGKTSVTVNAAAIKNIEGSAADVKAAYDANANKTISGLGNETVDLSAAAANASLVKAINDYTTGVITLGTVNVSAGNFSLSELGDLKGITGLNTLDLGAAGNTNITLSLKDLLASNDSTNSFEFKITNSAAGDTVKFVADTTGWTKDSTNSTVDLSIYKNVVTSQVIEIDHTGIAIV